MQILKKAIFSQVLNSFLLFSSRVACYSLLLFISTGKPHKLWSLVSIYGIHSVLRIFVTI
jgi:hypothetical protein